MTKTLDGGEINPNAPTVVRLGDHEYGLVPQRIGYLSKRLGSTFDNLVSSDDAESFANASGLGQLTEGTWRFLGVFIPSLMPLHEFVGYATAEAMKKDEYVDDADRSPTAPEIRHAIKLALKINEFDLLKHLGNFVGPEMIRAMIRERIATFVLESGEQPSSPSPSGASGSTISSQPELTSDLDDGEVETGDGDDGPPASSTTSSTASRSPV